MPTYNFRHKTTQEIIEKLLSLKERSEFLSNNPQYEQVHLSGPALGDPIRLGFKKVDDTFRDILKERKRKNHRSTINV